MATMFGSGSNVAALSGHGEIRSSVMGNGNRAATSEELAAMKSKLDIQMTAGSFGLSTGLFYAPGSFADTSEVIELARVAAARGGAVGIRAHPHTIGGSRYHCLPQPGDSATS